MGAYAQSDFDTLYRDSYNNLLRLAYRSTKDYHESEDLVDEAFVIYLQKSEIVHINNPRAYLVKIMSNLICNYLRLKMHDNVPLSNALENELGVDGLKRSLADALPKELQLWEREILLEPQRDSRNSASHSNTRRRGDPPACSLRHRDPGSVDSVPCSYPRTRNQSKVVFHHIAQIFHRDLILL